MVELLSNQFVTSEEHSLEQCHEAAALRVLDRWPSSPESLGATLETATSYVDSWLQGQARRKALDEKATARRRLLSYPGGRELLTLEMRLRELN